ncbi:Ras-GEF domain-containing protein [Entamoeba marina]
MTKRQSLSTSHTFISVLNPTKDTHQINRRSSFSVALSRFKANEKKTPELESPTPYEVTIKIYNMLTENVKYTEYQKLFKDHNFYLIKVIDMCVISIPLMVVWRLENFHRKILELLLAEYIEEKLPFESFAMMLFSQPKVDSNICKTFIQQLVENKTKIFYPTDPVFNREGEIISISQNKFFDFALDIFDIDNLLDTFIYSFPLFTDANSMYIKLLITKQAIESYYKEQVSVPIHIYEQKMLFEKMVIGVLELCGSFVEDKKDEILAQFTSPIFSPDFYDKIKQVLGLVLKPKKSILKVSTPNLKKSAHSHKVNSSSQGDIIDDTSLQSIGIDNFLTIHPIIVAEQLVYFDFTLLKQLHPHDIFTGKESIAIQKYLSKITSLSNLFKRFFGTTQTFEFFIKIAQQCYRMCDFNMTYLLLDIVQSEQLKYQTEFNEIDGGLIVDMNAILRKKSNYTNYVTWLDPVFAKVPDISIMINETSNLLNKIDSHSELLDMVALKKIASNVKLLVTSQKKAYDIQPNVSFQFFFNFG